jgi:NADH:ubiquinone oxidoreductase subunit D
MTTLLLLISVLLALAAYLTPSDRYRPLFLPLAGVGFDLEPKLGEQLLANLKAVEKNTLGACWLFFDTPSVLSRLEGVGRVSRSTAEDLGRWKLLIYHFPILSLFVIPA